MTKLDNLTNSFTKLNISNTSGHKTRQQKQPAQQHHQQAKSVDLDFDTVLQNDNTRKLFSLFLKGFNNSCDSLLTLYLICRCFQNPQRIEDRQRIKQILEKTYNTCFIKNNLTDLNSDLKEKIGQSLKKKTYNESVFTAVKAELKLLLETHYFPQFLDSDLYLDNAELFSSMMNSKPDSKLSDKHSTSVMSLDSNEKRDSSRSNLNKTASSLFAMPNIPQSKKNSSTNSRMLKQSKSSSSSTSSVASISSTSRSATSRLPRTGVNKSASKTSLTGLEYTGKLIRSNRDKSSTSINSLNLPPNPYHVATKAIPVSAQDSERQSVMSLDDAVLRNGNMHRLPKLNKHIKDNLKANMNSTINMPEFKPEHAVQPMKKPSDSKSQLPLSEANPQEFFNVLKAKLETYLAHKAYAKQQHASFSTTNKSKHNANETIEMSFRDNVGEQLAIPYESDIDAQLEEHMSRVYSNNENLNTSKMSFVKVSNLSRTKHDRSLNLSCISNVLPQSISESQHQKQHHFYKLTSTSKEVDIDDAHHQTKRGYNESYHSSKKSVSSAKNRLDSYDSGVTSIRSAASIERVNDWLNQTTNQNPIEELITKKPAPPVTVSTPDKKTSVQQEQAPVKKDTCDDLIKTTVAYYLPGEDLAYISQFNGEHLTLAQFKQLIAKKGQFRYFFKTKSDLLDEECVVFQEATDENSCVPTFNNKVIAKIQNC